MSKREEALVVPSPLEILRTRTTARIGLGRAGISLPTRPHLEFQLAHARARDAVHHQLDVPALQAALKIRGHETIVLHSAAADRHIYLQRPDQGRRLDDDSRIAMRTVGEGMGRAPDVAIVIADGLSALAIETNVTAFLDALLPKLALDNWLVAPLAIVVQGRVAVGDEVGEILRAQLVAILIGERPGLSSPDSMGVYLTYQPRVGITDARRNCISNIRPNGMPCGEAADKLAYLMREAQRRQLSGVLLKDREAITNTEQSTSRRSFLLGGFDRGS